MQKLLELLKSRKFWAALVGLGVVVVKAYRPDFPLSEQQITDLVYLLVAFILGTGIESGLQAAARLKQLNDAELARLRGERK